MASGSHVPGRKRKSRFSDIDSSKVENELSSKRFVDPATLAKVTAAKISLTIPGGSDGEKRSKDSNVESNNILLNEQRKRRKEQLWKSMQEQMGHIQNLLRRPGECSSGFMPAPLLLDAQGRQIDESGKVVEEKISNQTSTLKANKGTSRTSQNPYLLSIDKQDKLETLDPRLKLMKRDIRASKSLSFIKQGTYVKKAERIRAKDAKKMLAGFTSGRNPRGYNHESIVSINDEDADVSQRFQHSELLEVEIPLRSDSTTPEVEWWDVEYLSKDIRAALDQFGMLKTTSIKENPNLSVDYTKMKLKHCGTSHVIEHSAKLNSIVAKKDAPITIPLMLTVTERKKIRRQNRAEREKEKQDKIALGLVPPPEPKVKLSNMMRVLAEKAVSDPSAIEKKVREQIAQREKNHEMRNLARKLTPEERREKRLRKIKEDAAGEIHVALFRVADFSNSQHRFKVDVNAQQYHLTGGVLICQENNINLIVVEGGKKAVKHYIRLMMRRIDWNGSNNDDGDDENEKNSKEHVKGTHRCILVWQGVVARRAFSNFRFQECKTVGTARKVMETKNVVHYWDHVERAPISPV